MKVAQSVIQSLQPIPNGYIFTYADVMTAAKQKEAVIKALNRMAATGKIVKLAKGRFYKPEESTFGNLQPTQEEVVKDLLKKNGKTVGYLTGYSIYNQLGFTTQIGNTIQIGRNEIRPSFKRGRYIISFVRQKNAVTAENIPLLQILDSVRYQKRIPDAAPAFIGKRLYALIKALASRERKTLAQLASNYPPFVRAFVGAALEQIGESALIEPLRNSLNPISVYDLPAAQVLTFAKHWNIK